MFSLIKLDQCGYGPGQLLSLPPDGLQGEIHRSEGARDSQGRLHSIRLGKSLNPKKGPKKDLLLLDVDDPFSLSLDSDQTFAGASTMIYSIKGSSRILRRKQKREDDPLCSLWLS